VDRATATAAAGMITATRGDEQLSGGVLATSQGVKSEGLPLPRQRRAKVGLLIRPSAGRRLRATTSRS
jgi:hypothetical protein